MVTVNRKKQKKLEKIPFAKVKKDIKDNFLKYLGVEIDYSDSSLDKVSPGKYILNTTFPAYEITLVVSDKGPIGYQIEEIPPQEEIN
jgi:hypothetical protein